VQQLRF